MTHKITKIGILAEKKIRYFILPQSLEHFRDILSFQAAQTWYLDFTDEQIIDFIEHYKKLVDYYHTLPIKITYELLPDTESNNLYECFILVVEYAPNI